MSALCSWYLFLETDEEIGTNPPPSTTARLGKSSKLSASSEVIENSLQKEGQKIKQHKIR